MKALVLNKANTLPDFQDVPVPADLSGNSIVKLKAAAMNRRDFYICKGLYPGIKYPCILGSDGAGVVGGKNVIINPGFGWNSYSTAQPEAYSILGMPTNGTFAEFISIPTDRIYPMPLHLNFIEASGLGLAGLTAYRALFTKAKCTSNDTVLISGVGGGVACLALQFAIALGCDVYVTSGENSKIEVAMEMGALGGVIYKEDKFDEQLKSMSGGIDVIIDSAGGEGFNKLLKVCNPGARISIYGGTAGKITSISPQILFWKQIQILGTTMGSDEEFADMLEFVNQHAIIPRVDSVFSLKDVEPAFLRLGMSRGVGKKVFEI